MRLDPLDYKTPIGERLVPLQVKIYLPESFLCKYRCSYVTPVAVKDSLFHCLLHLLYPVYNAPESADWRVKLEMVAELKRALAARKPYFTDQSSAIDFICQVLNIKIAVVSDDATDFYGGGSGTSNLPCIYLYRDMLGVYSPVIINGQKIKKD